MAAKILSIVCLSLLLVAWAQARRATDYCGGVGDPSTHVMTVIMFRHGDRTPLKTYPNDKYQVDYWDPWGGWACLTQVGMGMHFRFGRWVRKCYGRVINDTYIPREVYIRSTDIDRTLESGLSHIAGLFKPHGFQVWEQNETLADEWQPIPIHTIDNTQEYLLQPNGGPCPPFDDALNKIWDTDPMIKQMEKDNMPLLEFIADKAGLKKPPTLRDVQDKMTDSYYVEVEKGLEIAPWINETIAQKLKEWKDLWLYANNANDEIVRLGMGGFIANIKQLFEKKKDGKITWNTVIYSAHDSTVGGVLYVYEPNWVVKGPPYAGGLFTELHKEQPSGRYFVKVFYRNDTKADPVEISIRGCAGKEKCWLEDFEKALEPFATPDRKAVCTAKPTPSDSGLSQDAIIAICVCATFGGTLLLSIIFFYIINKACK